jgi:hypothetical protein
MLILEIENNKNLFVENKTETLLCSLPIVETPSSHFV